MSGEFKNCFLNYDNLTEISDHQFTVAEAKARKPSRIQDSYDSFYDRTDYHSKKAKRDVKEENFHGKARKDLRSDYPEEPQGDMYPAYPDIEMPNMPVLPVDAPQDMPPAEYPSEVPYAEIPVPEGPVAEPPAPEAPATEAPATEAPAQETPAPETPAPETPAPETPAPETPAPEAPVVETSPAPEVPAPIPEIVLPQVVIPSEPAVVPSAPAADFDPFFKNPKPVVVKTPVYTFTPDAAFDFTAELDSTKVRLNAQVDRQNDVITDKFNDEITPMLKRLIEDIEMLIDVTYKVIERFDLKAPAMDLIRFMYYITTKTSNGIVVLQNYSTNTLLEGVVSHYKTSINTAIKLVQAESSKFVELIPTSNDCVYNVVTNFSTDAANSAYKILNQDAVNGAVKNFYTKVAEFQQAITAKQTTLANSIRPATLNKAPLDAYDRIQDVVCYIKHNKQHLLTLT